MHTPELTRDPSKWVTLNALLRWPGTRNYKRGGSKSVAIAHDHSTWQSHSIEGFMHLADYAPSAPARASVSPSMPQGSGLMADGRELPTFVPHDAAAIFRAMSYASPDVYDTTTAGATDYLHVRMALQRRVQAEKVGNVDPGPLAFELINAWGQTHSRTDTTYTRAERLQDWEKPLSSADREFKVATLLERASQGRADPAQKRAADTRLTAMLDNLRAAAVDACNRGDAALAQQINDAVGIADGSAMQRALVNGASANTASMPTTAVKVASPQGASGQAHTGQGTGSATPLTLDDLEWPLRTREEAEVAMAILSDTYHPTNVAGKYRYVSFNNDGGFDLMSDVDFRSFMANRNIEVQTKPGAAPKLIPLSDAWRKSASRPTFEGLIMDPHQSPGAAGKSVNLWRGFDVQPDASLAGADQLLDDHVYENICSGNADHYNWLMSWLAQMVQRPEHKLSTSVVLRGEKGTGKSMLADWMRRCVGTAHAFTASAPEHLLGKFNKHQARLVFLSVEEGFWAGDRAAEGVLKHLISGDRIAIESKGVDVVQVDSFVRLMFTSNEKWVVPAAVGERRYFVLDVPEHQHTKDTTYFGAIDKAMRSGGAEAFMHRLMTWDLPAHEKAGVDLRNPPMTAALRAQIAAGRRGLDAWFSDVAARGGFLQPSGHVIAPDASGSIECNLVFQSADKFVHKTGRGTATAVGEWLTTNIPNMAKHRVVAGSGRQRLYQFRDWDALIRKWSG